MSNLKKIETSIDRLESAAKNAALVLNEVTEKAYADSPALDEPLKYIHHIARALKETRDELARNADFEGLSEEEVAEKKATEKEAAIAKLQEAAAAALDELEAKRKPKPVVEEVLDVPPSE